MPGKHELIVGLGDRRYRLERPFGSWPSNEGFVTDVAVDQRGHVFVGLRHDPLTQADDPRIIELAPDGTFIRGWGETLIADTHLFTIAKDGRFLILDRDMHELVITSPDGERLGGLGSAASPVRPSTTRPMWVWRPMAIFLSLMAMPRNGCIILPLMALM